MQRMLRLAALLLSSAAANAAPGEWITSADLARQGTLTKLDKAGVTAVLARVPKGMYLIKDYVGDGGATVLWHKGDLTIDRSFSNDDVVVVDGNLTVKGDYDDYSPGIGVLLVLGDFTVSNVLSWGSIAVSGKLDSTGAVFAYYNDFTFEVAGPIKARAFLMVDKSGSIGDVEATVSQMDDEPNTAQALRHFVPELMIDDALDKGPDAFDDAAPMRAFADWDVAKALVHAGLPLFRDTPAPETLPGDAMKLFDPDTDAATVAKLAAQDRLLAMLAASREKPSLALQKQLLAGNEATVLARLATNADVDKGVLAQIAQKQPALSAAAAKNPNASPGLLAPMGKSDDPSVRIAVLEHKDVPVAQLAALAVDKDASVRLALAGSRHVRRLAPGDLDKLVADPDPAVRAAALLRADVLGIAHIAKLASDTDPKVRTAVAEVLVSQAVWRKLPVGSAAEREAIAAKLAADPVTALRPLALAALAPAEQERFFNALDAKIQERGASEYARNTRNVALMRKFAEAPVPVARELARNLALPPSVQARLVARLPSADKPRPSMMDLAFGKPEAIAESMDSWDTVIDELARNANAAPSTIAALAKYCVAIRGRAGFCNALLDRDDLSAETLTTLADIGDNEFREDWALTVLRSRHAQRRQLAVAVPRWYDDEEELLAEFNAGIKRGDDAAWLTSLAGSSHEQLREIAASNAATPPAVLVKLRTDASDDVRNNASRNPSLPAEAIAQATQAPSWVLTNPAITDTQVRQILTRMLADDESLVADDALEVLAARALRAAEG